METTLSVFVNGMTGVFAGMGVLYLTMKLLAYFTESASEEPSKKD